MRALLVLLLLPAVAVAGAGQGDAIGGSDRCTGKDCVAKSFGTPTNTDGILFRGATSAATSTPRCLWLNYPTNTQGLCYTPSTAYWILQGGSNFTNNSGQNLDWTGGAGTILAKLVQLQTSSGSDAIKFANPGARLSLGSTSRYAIDDGTGFSLVPQLRLQGRATGSLATCNSGNKGAIDFDTTSSTLKFCNGTEWISTGTSKEAVVWTASGYYNLNVTGKSIAKGNLDNPGIGNIKCNDLSTTIIVAGVGAGNAYMKLFNSFDGTIILQEIPCASAAGQTFHDGNSSSTLGSANGAEIQWDASSACTTLPTVNVTAFGRYCP